MSGLVVQQMLAYHHFLSGDKYFMTSTFLMIQVVEKSTVSKNIMFLLYIVYDDNNK